MSCEIIDCVKLFDAIKNKKDEWCKAAMVLNLQIPFDNKITTAEKVIKREDVKSWFILKLYEYYGGDDYA